MTPKELVLNAIAAVDCHDLVFSRNLGIDFTRRRAVVSRDRGQPFREVGQAG